MRVRLNAVKYRANRGVSGIDWIRFLHTVYTVVGREMANTVTNEVTNEVTNKVTNKVINKVINEMANAFANINAK